MFEINKEQAQEYIKDLGKLENNRKPLESVWQTIMEMIDPANAFITKKYAAKKVWNEKIYSTTAQRALPKFVAALQSTVTPNNQRWHRFTAPLNRLKDNQKVTSWLEKLTDAVFEMRYRPNAGFNKAIIKTWRGYGKLGLGVMFVDEDKDGDGATYESVNIKDFYPVLYKDGTIKTCFRKVIKSGWEVCETLKNKGIEPEKVIPSEVWSKIKANKFCELSLIHVVCKLTKEEIDKYKDVLERPDGTKIVTKYRYKSYLILNDMNKPAVLDSGKFFTCPYMFTRYQELDYDIYSNSPSLEALPDIKMLQRVRKSTIEAAEKAVDPPLLARNDAAFGGLMPVAGAIMAGTLDSEGRELLKPLQTGDNTRLGVEMEELVNKGIEDFYLVPLYMMYYQEGKMTATEINQRASERAMIMSINVFPIENELLDPMVARELDIMKRQGKLPDNMPEELQALMDSDEPYAAIQYEGEQHKAQELIKANGIATTMQAAIGLSNFDRHIPLAFKSYKCLTTMASANGMPADHLLAEDDYNDLAEQQAKADNAAAIASAIDSGAANVAGDVSARYDNKLASGNY